MNDSPAAPRPGTALGMTLQQRGIAFLGQFMPLATESQFAEKGTLTPAEARTLLTPQRRSLGCAALRVACCLAPPS